MLAEYQLSTKDYSKNWRYQSEYSMQCRENSKKNKQYTLPKTWKVSY